MHSQNKFQAGLSQAYRLKCALVVLPGYATIVEVEQTTQHRGQRRYGNEERRKMECMSYDRAFLLFPLSVFQTITIIIINVPESSVLEVKCWQ